MASCIHRAPIIERALWVTAILSVGLSVAMPAAHAAELRVPVSFALRGPVAEVAAAFEKESGHTVKMTVAAPGEIVAARKPASMPTSSY
jgi:ABC-type molybdate transport system substrate-binding protein